MEAPPSDRFGFLRVACVLFSPGWLRRNHSRVGWPPSTASPTTREQPKGCSGPRGYGGVFMLCQRFGARGRPVRSLVKGMWLGTRCALVWVGLGRKQAGETLDCADGKAFEGPGSGGATSWVRPAHRRNWRSVRRMTRTSAMGAFATTLRCVSGSLPARRQGSSPAMKRRERGPS